MPTKRPSQLSVALLRQNFRNSDGQQTLVGSTQQSDEGELSKSLRDGIEWDHMELGRVLNTSSSDDQSVFDPTNLW